MRSNKLAIVVETVVGLVFPLFAIAIELRLATMYVRVMFLPESGC